METPSTPSSGNTNVTYVEEEKGGSSSRDSGEVIHGDAPQKLEITAAAVLETSTWSRAHDVAFIVSVCLAQFLSLVTLAQTVTPVLIIGESLNVKSSGEIAWFTSAYSMTVGTFILPSGMSGNIHVREANGYRTPGRCFRSQEDVSLRVAVADAVVVYRRVCS